MNWSTQHPFLDPPGPDRLRYFLLASLLVHALVSFVWTGSPPAGMPGGGVLQVVLVGGAVPTAGDDGDDGPARTVPEASGGDVARKAGGHTEVPSQSDTHSPVAPPLAEEQPEPAGGILAVAAEAAPSRTDERPRATARKAEQSATQPAQAPPDSPHLERRKPPSPDPRVVPDAAQARAAGTPAVDTDLPRPTESPGASPVAGTGGGNGGDAHERVQAALRKALLTRFDYPLLARRRGWEGEVRLGLRVEADGELGSIRVVETSGYRVLDRAAVRDLEEVDTLPTLKRWLDGMQMDVVLPVEYRLAGGERR